MDNAWATFENHKVRLEMNVTRLRIAFFLLSDVVGNLNSILHSLLISLTLSDRNKDALHSLEPGAHCVFIKGM